MPVTKQQIFSRALRCRCPNCGGPLVFGRGMRLLEFCPRQGCDMHWQRSNGFYLGAMVFNYGLTVFGVLPFVLLAGIYGLLSTRAAMAAGLVVALVFPVIFYKWAWSLWLGVYYFFLPNELPANMSAEESAHPHEDD